MKKKKKKKDFISQKAPRVQGCRVAQEARSPRPAVGGLSDRAVHSGKRFQGSKEANRKETRRKKERSILATVAWKEWRRRLRRIARFWDSVGMSFKREGDDWSQLNVLKVSTRGERREQFHCPVESCFVALATAAGGGAGGSD